MQIPIFLSFINRFKSILHMRYNHKLNCFFDAAYINSKSSDALLHEFGALLSSLPTIKQHTYLFNNLLYFLHLSLANKRVPSQIQSKFSITFCNSSSSFSEYLDVIFILDALSCHHASSSIYRKSIFSLRFMFHKPFIDTLFGIFYTISPIRLLSFLSSFVFDFVLFLSKWFSLLTQSVKNIPWLFSRSSLLQSVSSLQNLIASTDVYILCPGPRFSLSHASIQPNSTVFLFNKFLNEDEIVYFESLNIRIIICLAHRVVDTLSSEQLSFLNSNLVGLVLVKTSDDLTFLNNTLISPKCIFTPQLKLINAELNVAVDIAILCYALRSKKIFFYFSTLYVDSLSAYTTIYHRNLIQNFQFA